MYLLFPVVCFAVYSWEVSLTSSPKSLAEFYIFALIFFSENPSCSLCTFFYGIMCFSTDALSSVLSLSLDVEGFVFIVTIFFLWLFSVHTVFFHSSSFWSIKADHMSCHYPAPLCQTLLINDDTPSRWTREEFLTLALLPFGQNHSWLETGVGVGLSNAL